MQKSYINDGWIARNSNNISNLCFCMLHCIIPEFMIMGCLFSHIFRADMHMNVERIDFYISRTISSQSQKLGERVQRHRWRFEKYIFMDFGPVQSVLDMFNFFWTPPNQFWQVRKQLYSTNFCFLTHVQNFLNSS